MVLNKKIVVAVVVFVLILGVGGFFYAWQNKEIQGSPADYTVKETAEGKIVENKKAGLTVKIPEGWVEEKMNAMEGSMVFYTSDLESINSIGKMFPPFKKGCMIATAVGYKKTTFNEIQKATEEAHKSLIIKLDTFEAVMVDGKSALKNTFDSANVGHSIDIYVIPRENIVYRLAIIAAAQEVERCSQEFDKFLETVQIQ